MLGRKHYTKGALQNESVLLWLQTHFQRLFALWRHCLAFLDERRIEVQHALFRRVLPHMRVVDVAATVVRRVLEHVVELADAATLSSVLLAKQGNVGSNIALLGVLPSALSAMSELLAAVVSGSGQSVCSDDAPPESPPVTLRSAADVASPQLDRSTADAWRSALGKLRGEDLTVLAARHGVPVGASKSATLAALATDAVRLATPLAETPLPWPLTADALVPFVRDQLSVWCRRAKLKAHGTKPALIERLCIAAGAPPPPRPQPTADELRELREQRTYRTPLVGVLGVRQMPLTYRFSARPPQHGRAFCRTCDEPIDLSGPFVRSACGCVFHDVRGCRPADGHCFACLDAVLDGARVNGETRNATIAQAVQQLASGDDSVAGDDDSDDDDDGGDGAFVDDGDDGADDVDAERGHRLTVGELRAALDSARAACRSL